MSDYAAKAAQRLLTETIRDGQVAELLAALEDAIASREGDGSCGYCGYYASGLCTDHATDRAIADKYRELRTLLGSPGEDRRALSTKTTASTAYRIQIDRGEPETFAKIEDFAAYARRWIDRGVPIRVALVTTTTTVDVDAYAKPTTPEDLDDFCFREKAGR